MDQRNIQADQALLDRIKNGDRKAFSVLYDMYAHRLKAFASNYLNNELDQEGFVQDIFIKLWEKRSTIKTDKPFNPYLFTIAKNAVFNLLSKKQYEIKYLNYLKKHIQEKNSKTENDLILADLSEFIDKTIASLPEKQRMVYTLSRKDGLSYKAIAKEMEISEKTVEVHMRLALQKLKASLQSIGIHASMVGIVLEYYNAMYL